MPERLTDTQLRSLLVKARIEEDQLYASILDPFKNVKDLADVLSATFEIEDVIKEIGSLCLLRDLISRVLGDTDFNELTLPSGRKLPIDPS